MRHELDGDLTRGSFFVDKNGSVRWISVEDTMEMKGEGNYNGGSGYPAYNE